MGVTDQVKLMQMWPISDVLDAAAQTGNMEKPISLCYVDSLPFFGFLDRGLHLTLFFAISKAFPIHSRSKIQHISTIPAWMWWSRATSNPLLWDFTPTGTPGLLTSRSEIDCFLLSPSLFSNAHLWTKPKNPALVGKKCIILSGSSPEWRHLDLRAADLPAAAKFKQNWLTVHVKEPSSYHNQRGNSSQC